MQAILVIENVRIYIAPNTLFQTLFLLLGLYDDHTKVSVTKGKKQKSYLLFLPSVYKGQPIRRNLS